MGKNLPLHVDMSTLNAIRQRAERAFKGELQSIAYAFSEIDTSILEQELRLAFYRVAMSGPTPIHLDEGDSDASDSEKRDHEPQDAPGDELDEPDVWPVATPVPEPTQKNGEGHP